MVKRCAQAAMRRDVPASVEEDGLVKEWIFLHGCASRSCSWLCGAKPPQSARTAAIVPGTRPQCCAQMQGCGRSQRVYPQKQSPSTWSAITSGTSQREPSVIWSTCGTCTCPTIALTRCRRGPCGTWDLSCVCWTSHITS